jgi:hypothetical protein
MNRNTDNLDLELSKSQNSAICITMFSLIVFIFTFMTKEYFTDIFMIKPLNLYAFKTEYYTTFWTASFFLFASLLLASTLLPLSKKINKLSIPLSLIFVSSGVCLFSLSSTLPFHGFPSRIEAVSPNHHAVKMYQQGISDGNLDLIRKAIKHEQEVSDETYLLIRLFTNSVACTLECDEIQQISEHDYISKYDYEIFKNNVISNKNQNKLLTSIFK